MAVAAIIWLLVDLLRGWTPLLITVFGRAAETPPELIGLFALGVTTTPLVILLLAGRRLLATHNPTIAIIAVALIARLATPVLSGRPLLAVTSMGVIAAVLGLAVIAARNGPGLVTGVLTGLAMATVTHAMLGTWGAVWRVDLKGALVSILLVAFTFDTLRRPRDEAVQSPTPRSAFITMLVVLLATQALANPARAMVADPRGAVVVAVAATLAALLAFRPLARPWRVAGGALLVASTGVTMMAEVTSNGVDNALPWWSLLGFAVGMPSLAVVLAGTSVAGPVASTPPRPRRAALALAAGAPVFTALLFAFYAGYDLGYRADWVPVLVAVAITLAALVSVAATGTHEAAAWLWRPRVVGGLLVGAAVLAWAGPALSVMPLAPRDGLSERTLTVAAWNLRMGYGIDGTFRPRALAELLQEQNAEIIMLSEIDRGWLLNGGQDQLRILARLLNMQLTFGPAGDQVWGDAILSRTPLTNVRSVRLPTYDSLTGAQVLAATTSTSLGPIRIVSTHIQPDSSGDEPSLRQARDIRAFVAEEQRANAYGHLRGLVLGGDFNLQPGGREFDALVRETDGQSNLVDALNEARPLLTSSSDDLDKQIDHILVTPSLVPSNPRTVQSLLSDHLPVFVDLRVR